MLWESAEKIYVASKFCSKAKSVSSGKICKMEKICSLWMSDCREILNLMDYESTEKLIWLQSFFES